MRKNQWFTSNQERQMFCCDYITKKPEYRDIRVDGLAVGSAPCSTVYTRGVVQYHASVAFLRKNFLVLLADGRKVVYC